MGLCAIAQVAVFAVPTAAEFGVAGADVTVKAVVEVASAVVGAIVVVAQCVGLHNGFDFLGTNIAIKFVVVLQL